MISEVDECEHYLAAIRIRSILHQQLSLYRDDRNGCHYPFMLFAVFEQEVPLMLEIDFIKKVIVFRQKDHSKVEYAMSQIK